MISRRRFIVQSAHAVAGSVVLQACASRGSSAELRELDALVPELMREATVPGASMAVIKDAEVVWHRSYGVRDTASRTPVDEHSVFAAASVSKTVFAYAVMQLVDRGVLALDQPLTAYMPDRILDGDPRLDLITARHVLTHSSGLPNFRSGAEPLRIHFMPGEKYQYSGEGFWYLQSVLTQLVGVMDARSCAEYEAGMRVCATDFPSYMKANVLDPLGMRSSAYIWSPSMETHIARPHDGEGKPLTSGKTTPTDAARYAAMGGLRTTALDYANVLIEMVAPRAPARFRLSDATRLEMIRPQLRVDDTTSRALGWELRHTPTGTLIQHAGGQSGVHAFAAASIEKRSGYAIFTNGANGYKVLYDERFTNLMDRIVLT